jgi:hypothetical protein
MAQTSSRPVSAELGNFPGKQACAARIISIPMPAEKIEMTEVVQQEREARCAR